MRKNENAKVSNDIKGGDWQSTFSAFFGLEAENVI
jgi:hypothetical protein